MSDSFDADHGVDSRRAWKAGAVHHEEIARFPRFAVGISSRSLGRTAQAGRSHDVEGKKREAARIPPSRIHSFRKRIDRAAAPGLVSAPFGVRRKNMEGAGCFENARCGNKSLAQMPAVERRKGIVGNGIALWI